MPFKAFIGNTLIPSYSTLFLEYQNIKCSKLEPRTKLYTIETLLSKLYAVHIYFVYNQVFQYILNLSMSLWGAK